MLLLQDDCITICISYNTPISDIEYHHSSTENDWSYSKFELFLTQSNSRNQPPSRSKLSSISATLSKSTIIKTTKHILFLLLSLKFKSLYITADQKITWRRERSVILLQAANGLSYSSVRWSDLIRTMWWWSTARSLLLACMQYCKNVVYPNLTRHLWLLIDSSWASITCPSSS